jgi:hypothetical protein
MGLTAKELAVCSKLADTWNDLVGLGIMSSDDEREAFAAIGYLSHIEAVAHDGIEECRHSDDPFKCP